MAKTAFPYISIFLTALVILLVFHIVTTKNPLADYIKEGFQAPVLTTPQCPKGFKFFNDKMGESFCCNGPVNPFTHSCTVTGEKDLCAFKPKVQDPRNPSAVLPLCTNVITTQASTAQKDFCPKALPNYASIGKCCMSSTDLDGVDCSAYDNAHPNQYCVIKDGGCSSIQRVEETKCPAQLATVQYKLGKRETDKYGSKVEGLQIPVCFSPESSCISDNILSYAQEKGAWTDKNTATWKYACTNWDKVNVQRDLTGISDTNYT